MCDNYKKAQQNVCLVCLNPLLKEISFVHIVHSIPICQSCLQKLEVLDWHTRWNGYPLHILYAYNDFFKSLLFQYKGLYDYALKDVFLSLFSHSLQTQFSQHIFVIAPSSEEDNRIRGFAPVEEIVRTVSSNIFVGLYKKEKYKQSSLSYEERRSVIKKIGIRGGEELRGKKVVIVDDVLTSGSTMNACLSLIQKTHPKSIELLILSTKKKVI